jgi:hypothetical protein
LSASIGQVQLDEFVAELSTICETTQPDKVRVLWWDTQVNSEQVFTENYDNMKAMLKPDGGGGTHVGCVSDYIMANRYNPDCVIVFTDGYVESNIDWQVSKPTLWMVTENTSFTPPNGGQSVHVPKEV